MSYPYQRRNYSSGRVAGAGQLGIGGGGGRGFRIPPQLIIGVVIALFSLGSYVLKSSYNPVLKVNQRVSMSVEEEIAIGLNTAPQMIREMGGLSKSARADALVDQVGARLVAALPSNAPKYPYEFHVLADTQTVNAFALPGGQIFITEALLTRLETEGQLAGVLGHEIGHVVARHSAQRIEKAKLTQGLVTGVAVGASGSGDGGRSAGMLAQTIGGFINMKYGRDDELESDRLGLQFMHGAGYNPKSLIGVMEILEQASGGSQRPEFSSTHPNPGRRIERIEAAIEELFPQGLGRNLRP